LVPTFSRADERNGNPIDELIKELKTKPDLKVEKIKNLPKEIQGPIDIIGEFDEENNKWVHFTNSERYGEINPTFIIFLDYKFGDDGFVRTKYPEIKDRRVVTYTGINSKGNFILSILDDESSKDSLVVNVNIGPKKIRYLMSRLK
jgi:hypothetical protein